VYTETIEDDSRIQVVVFDEHGKRDGDPFFVSQQAAPAVDANPAAAELPDSRFAVLWTDQGLGTLDVVVQVVSPQRAIVSPPRVVNQNTVGVQRDPDAIWIDNELVVAWTNGLDVAYRSLSGGATPLSAEQPLAATAEIESNVSLARFGNGWAAAWRAGIDGMERIRVRAGTFAWAVGPQLPGPEGDRPALVELDSNHLLLVFTDGTAPAGGPASVGRLRGAILATGSPGNAEAFELSPLVEPYASDDSLAQRRPALARVGTRWFLGWQTQSPLGDALGQELWLAEMHWSGALTRLAEMPLAFGANRIGDQQSPVLAATPLFPAGALISVWEDASGELENRPVPDVLMSFRPVPFVSGTTGENEPP
jgi:hypothetical protein